MSWNNIDQCKELIPVMLEASVLVVKILLINNVQYNGNNTIGKGMKILILFNEISMVCNLVSLMSIYYVL